MKKIIIFLFAFTIGKAQVTSTIAGSTQGYADGTGTAAQFYLPYGITTDPAGNIYVADTGNNKIRKITSTGVVTTFAGSTQGFADGTGTAAKFFLPYGLTSDAAGNIYVADQNNYKIRKITPQGVVTTIAGTIKGDQDGSVATAKFDSPYALRLDATGNIYVSDNFINKIKKITPQGMVTTIAQNSQTWLDIFENPRGFAIDATGNIYVALWGTSVIGKITPAGVISTFAGLANNKGFADGTGTTARFNLPSDIVIDPQGNLYVTDQDNSKIRKITPDGTVTTLAGSSTGAPGYQDGTTALFHQPTAMAADAFGNLYIADSSNHKIRKISNAFLNIDLNEIKDDGLKIYPVPAKDILNISFNKKITSISLYNILGQEVMTELINNSKGSLDISRLVSGTYVVKINADNTIKTVKILKQ